MIPFSFSPFWGKKYRGDIDVKGPMIVLDGIECLGKGQQKVQQVGSVVR